ncbi:hypothetical protein WMY93_007272 [Mugilogobius chulae]|uniref:CCHC-type domain-containing protein n=1 Tax=Mugilogobius chulae TaxID=88201 RepID=A0AAW0PMN7_9GOBI
MWERNSKEDNGYKKKKKKRPLSDTSSEESYLVGMVALDREDGLFSNQHEVGKYVGEMVGDVRSVTVTRSGVVIIDCKSVCQRKNALDICAFEKGNQLFRVNCFVFDKTAKKKGVVSGVPVAFDEELFLSVDGVCGVRRLMRTVNGERDLSTSVCLSFREGMPDRVYLDYICYRVRPFERGPLRCFACQEYGHVASVCRGVRRCYRCGMSDCLNESCARQGKEPKCVHCKGNHSAGASSCPRRVSEEKICDLRVNANLSYAEAVKQVECREENKEKEVDFISVDKKNFLAFIVHVINCSLAIQSKSERIDMIIGAAKRFMNVVDVSGEELFMKLNECRKQTG